MPLKQIALPLNYERRVIVETALAQTPATDSRILDLGCGVGQIAWTLAQSASHITVEGFDGDSLRIEQARQLPSLPDLTFEYFLFKDMNLGEARYDVIIFSNVIEHLLDPGAVLLRIHHALKPGGVLVLSTNNVFYFKSLIKAVLQGYKLLRVDSQTWWHQDEYYWWNQHIQMWNMDALVTLLTVCGFDIHNARYIPKDWYRFRRGLLVGQTLLEALLPFLRAKVLISAIQREPTTEERKLWEASL